MNTKVYSHRSGIKIVSSDILDHVLHILSENDMKMGNNIARSFRNDFLNKLYKDGWAGEYRLDSSSMISITSFRNGIGLCLQTGNAARMYADLLKLQTLYIKDNIQAGIIILPMEKTARLLGKGLATYERMIRELPIFTQVISVPVIVVGFEEREL